MTATNTDPLLPSAPLAVLIKVMQDALAKHGRDGWRSRPMDEHIEHAMDHLSVLAYLDAGNDPVGLGSEDNLAHAACRLWLALALREEQKGKP